MATSHQRGVCSDDVVADASEKEHFDHRLIKGLPHGIGWDGVRQYALGLQVARLLLRSERRDPASTE